MALRRPAALIKAETSRIAPPLAATHHLAWALIATAWPRLKRAELPRRWGW